MAPKQPETTPRRHEWVQYPLPVGFSPIGRIFEAGEIRLALGTGRKMTPRNYPGYAIVMITRLDGPGYYHDSSGFRCVLHTGDCILVHPERTHSYGPEKDTVWSEIYVSFDGPVFDELNRRGLLDANRTPVFPANDPGFAKRLLGVILEDNGTPPGMLVATGRVVALIAELAAIRDAEKPAMNAASWIARASRDALRENTTVAEILARYTAETGMSPEALRKSYRRATGESLENRRLAARLAAAITLIEQGEAPLKSIAHRLGFCNEQHFSRTVTKATGFTPGAIRARAAFHGKKHEI